MSEAVSQGTESTNELTVFSAIFKEDANSFIRKQELIRSFNTPEVFKNEFNIFYILTKEFPKVVPSKDFIKMFLQTNRSGVMANPNIDIDAFRVGESDPFVEFVNSTLSIFEECVKKTVSDSDYHRAVEMHKMEFISKESISLLEDSAMILAEGIPYRNRKLSGYTDMRAYMQNGFQKIDNMVNKTDRKGLVIYGVDEDMEEEDTGIKLITKFGVTALDNAIGGIFEGDMVSLLAPAKGAKSRFATYVLHTAVISGAGIVMWSVENGYKGWEYLIRARHFNWFYNSKVSDVTQKRIITADMIRKGELTGDLKDMELASWTDLKTNENYGRIVNLDEDFNFESFLEVVDTAVNAIGAKLICVDYLQLITGGNSRMMKNERIGEAYKSTLQYLKKKKIGGIFPAQLKQTVVGDIKKSDPAELINMELRDAAGESYEVIKTPDINLALYGTPEDIRNGEMKLLSIPSRNSAPFEPINLYVDAGSCTFASIDANVS